MMREHSGALQQSIMRDMSEGVMAIGCDGTISYINPAAAMILDTGAETLLGRRFAECFFEYPENDSFTQTVLDAIYDTTVTHRNVVPYFTGKQMRQLHLVTSYLMDGEQKAGVVLVISDVSELSELRDAVRAMERIRELNGKLELRNKLLSETFGRFLSDEIVHQLLETPDGLALGGKKRTLTIMMSDLRGFTAMSERMEPQGLISMLNHYLGEMTDVIQSRNGTIIEFIGDGIMAIFGAPAESGCHAADAVAAAVEMQSRMTAVNAWNAERGYPALEMGIGLNTGEVIVGNIGSEKRTKYGVVGSNVNLCGRIESYTTGGQVLISPRTRELIKEPLDIAAEQEVLPKGVDKPLLISEVTGIGGGYGVSYTPVEELPQPLAAPREVQLYVIREKHTGLRPYRAVISAIGNSCAIVETEAALARFDNVQIEAGGKLFCKVISQSGPGWLLRFTAVPMGFAEWRRER